MPNHFRCTIISGFFGRCKHYGDECFKKKAISDAPAVFQELTNKILYQLRCPALVQEPVELGAQMKAHIDDDYFGMNTTEDHYVLLTEFFGVCQGYHMKVKLEKSNFMKKEIEYVLTLGTDGGHQPRRKHNH